MTEEPRTIIFIDGSYFCFHRYYSIVRWWKNAFPENQDVLLNPYENELFREKFIKTFIEAVKEIPKKLGIKKENRNRVKMIVGKDCPRKDIWRNEIYEKYKANRQNGPEDGFMGGPFFKMAYEDDLFVKGGVEAILSLEKLEADDCIALSVKHLLKKSDTNCRIFVITSDMDYLQLHCERVQIFDLAYKNVAEKKTSFGSAEANLFCKIVMGDTSDNISSIFKKCGPKTALKCWQDKAYFENKLNKENAHDKYELNRIIVSFDCIPQIYIDNFHIKYVDVMKHF